MALKCVKAFSWAHQGNRVRAYEPGQVVEDDAELEPIALERGWVAIEKAPAAPAAPAKPANGKAVAPKGKAPVAPPAPSGGASAAGK